MGRKLKLTIAVLLCGLSVSGTYVGRRAEANAAAAAASTQKKLSRKPQPTGAKVLYVENCARCHGADGRSQTPMGKIFEAPNLTDADWWKKERLSDKRIAATIRDGRNQMPAFGKKLSKEEIAALVAFVKTFKGK
jgi:mono/diheme cytochrome c family protein